MRIRNPGPVGITDVIFQRNVIESDDEDEEAALDDSKPVIDQPGSAVPPREPTAGQLITQQGLSDIKIRQYKTLPLNFSRR